MLTDWWKRTFSSWSPTFKNCLFLVGLDLQVAGFEFVFWWNLPIDHDIILNRIDKNFKRLSAKAANVMNNLILLHLSSLFFGSQFTIVLDEYLGEDNIKFPIDFDE